MVKATRIRQNELAYDSRQTMTIEHTEKRNFIRMQTDAKINFTPQGSAHTFQGDCINLSASGVLFTSEQRFNPGTFIDINITPHYSVVQPLEATIEVVRSSVHNSGRFAIAGEIKKIN